MTRNRYGSRNETIRVKEFSGSWGSLFGKRYLSSAIGLSILISWPTAALAAYLTPSPGPVHQPNAGARNNSPSVGGGNLNLRSPSKSYSISELGSAASVTIPIGGKNVTFNLNAANTQKTLTAAEFVALASVVAGAHPTLNISSFGVATSGSLSSAGLANTARDLGLSSLNSLTIPKNVTLVANSNLVLSNKLLNYGRIVETGNFTISDKFTLNASGALISSSSSGNLELNSQSLLNQGSIYSYGTLTLGIPNIKNTGTIVSRTGNVNFVSSKNITLNNTSGKISAAQNINFRSSSYAGVGDISISGGSLFSHALNLNAGTGNVDLYKTNVNGIVNANAGKIHLDTNSPNLILGNINATLDPLIANLGNVTINGNLIGPVNGAPLSVVASGNILSGGGAIDTSSTAGDGGQINLIAGANFTSQGAGQVTVIPTSNPGGGSITGGLIDLTGGHGGTAPITGINSSSSAGDGGNITMLATVGSGAGSGGIIIPSNVTISARGSIHGGNISILSGTNSGTAISLGNVDATGGPGAFNNSIVIATTTSPISAPTIVTAATGLTFVPTLVSFPEPKGNITVGSIYNPGQLVNVATFGKLSFQTIDVSGYGGTSASPNGQAGGNIGVRALSLSGNNLYAFGGGGVGGTLCVNNDTDTYNAGVYCNSFAATIEL